MYALLRADGDACEGLPCSRACACSIDQLPLQHSHGCKALKQASSAACTTATRLFQTLHDATAASLRPQTYFVISWPCLDAIGVAVHYLRALGQLEAHIITCHDSGFESGVLPYATPDVSRKSQSFLAYIDEIFCAICCRLQPIPGACSLSAFDRISGLVHLRKALVRGRAAPLPCHRGCRSRLDTSNEIKEADMAMCCCELRSCALLQVH